MDNCCESFYVYKVLPFRDDSDRKAAMDQVRRWGAGRPLLVLSGEISHEFVEQFFFHE